MNTFKTPVSALQASAKKYPDRAVLKTPEQSPEGLTFKDITFTQFQKDVELSARYWKNQLSQIGAEDRAVVGVWSAFSIRETTGNLPLIIPQAQRLLILRCSPHLGSQLGWLYSTTDVSPNE